MYIGGITMRKTPVSQKQAVALYAEYFESRTEDDSRLQSVILDHESLFDDMCLDVESAVRDFLIYQIQMDDGQYLEASDDHYIGLGVQCWRFYVRRLRDKDMMGVTYPNERKIVINEPYKNDLPTILHEMIHAHEAILNQFYPFYRDTVMLCLYKELEQKIPNLYQRLIDHAHEYRALEVTEIGGSHDILFFLKSLDLDLRLGYALGTVCGYGRDSFSNTGK